MTSKYCQVKNSYESAQENIHGIKKFICQADIIQTETDLKECFSSCMQIPKPTENHGYTPWNSNTMRVLRVSGSSMLCYIALCSSLPQIWWKVVIG
jgi:hypothetical protein